MNSFYFSNKDESQLGGLYRKYLACLDNQLSDFLSKKENEAQGEWCADEKRKYYNHMKDNYKTEYENIIRLESNNY